ncbi:hypothetical protein F1D05_16975 [Kribbella qitaiheensis]|uniref:Uncharacterized protein n=1 Tax=Kribbella qitaiheensis TaxID=1544730 RepID=A0A7G6WZ84_9ACTN|nr:hypothetical protein [Kribbella qitaiheensis]QNE19299.1 hypothetical protein F1D05_16975 [Kribbella qitaiheensis]
MKHAAAVLTLALLTVGLTAPTATAADSAPTDVKVSWKDDTFQFIHVTWSEDAPQPNRIVVRKVGETTERAGWHVTADGANAFDVPKSAVRQGSTVKDVLEIGVAAGTEAGETSPVAVSAAFDIHYPAQPLFEDMWPAGTNTLTARWYGWNYQDPNPGDPLDRADPVTFNPTYQIGSAAPVLIGKPTTETTVFFAGPKPPYDFYVWSENEWARGVDSARGHARTTAFTASVPSWVVAGTSTVVSGTYAGPSTARVTLQARNSATSAWYAVAGSDFSGSKYRFAIPSQGTRQYRVAIGNRSDGLTAWYGGYSAAVTTTVQQKVTTDGSRTVHRYYGEAPQMYVYVSPAIEGAAAMQRWNGKVWVFVQNVNLRNGWGRNAISRASLGSTTYRYYVPNHLYGGNLVAAAYSPNFVITVQP